MLYLAFIGPYAAAVGLEPRVRGHLLSFVFISPFMVAGGIGMMLSNLLRAHGGAGHVVVGTATVALLDPLVIFVFKGGLQGVAWAGAVGRLAAWAAGWCSDAIGRPEMVAPRQDRARLDRPTPAAVIFAASTYAGFGSSVMAGATAWTGCCNWPIRCAVLPAPSGRSWAEPGRGTNWDRIRETARLTARLALAAGSAGDLRFQGGLQGVAWAGAVGRLATMLLGGWLVFGRHRLVSWPTRESCGRRWPRSAGSPRPPP